MTTQGRTTNVVKALQNRVAEREPFNEQAIRFRETEDIPYLLENIFRGLEIVKGVELLYVRVNPEREVYEAKKPEDQLTKEEKAELKEYNRRTKNVYRGKNSQYPLTPITQTRYIDIEFSFRYTYKGKSEELVYHLYYPELVNNEHFLINGNKFYPIFQLADGEFYRSGRSSIVFKNMFMPITVRGNKEDYGDYFEEFTHTGRYFELRLFGKEVNIFLYFLAKYNLKETLAMFDLTDIFSIKDGDLRDLDEEDMARDKFYYFRLNTNLYMEVPKEWLESYPLQNLSLVLTFGKVFSNKKVSYQNLEDQDYWMNRLGREFTTNSNRAHEKAASTLVSLERLLDLTSKNNMRLSEERKKTVYHLLVYMVENFNNILRIDNYDLANKRLRVAEYLLYPLTHKLSSTVYRLISRKNPTLKQQQQLFSSVEPTFILDRLSSIPLIRFNNQVNTIDLFARTLKGSKDGPQAQKMDSSGQGIGIKGIDTSYLGSLDVVSTSSNDPGVSFTVTPFTEVHDPNNSGAFYFSDRMNIDEPDQVEGITELGSVEPEDEEILEELGVDVEELDIVEEELEDLEMDLGHLDTVEEDS